MGSKSCYLRFVTNPEKRILLPHKEAVTIGRTPQTEIEDIHVSREQLQLKADLTSSTVLLKTIGKSHSGCNGYALMKNEVYQLKHGDKLEVRLGCHELELVFEPKSEDELAAAKRPKLENGTEGKWEDVDGKDLLIYTPTTCKSQEAIAAFDLDGTVIKTRSGAKFPKNPEDWQLNFADIPQKLRKLHDDNYKIVFFTNQSGLAKDPNKIKQFKGKIEAITSKLALPIQTYIATGRSIYRKPAPGMWHAMLTKNGKPVDISRCFYVGDAAGREKNWAPKRSKDHSMADRLFALNLNLKFYTPEEHFFKSSPAPFAMPEFDPRKLPPGRHPEAPLGRFEVVLMVGCQGSGKSHYCKSQLVPKGYSHVSTDKLGSWQKCVKAMEKSLEKRQSVVIDNTNPDKESRLRFVEAAKKFEVDCRCFLMSTSFQHCKHNNRFRELTDKAHVAVSEILLNSYRKKFQEPELSEGFSEIVAVPFVPKFDNNQNEKLYKMFLLES